jgi:hypothetical protein
LKGGIKEMKKKKLRGKQVSWKILAIAVLLIIILSSLAFLTITGKSVVANGPRCKDSDGGINPLVPGTCKNYNLAGSVTATYHDSCAGSMTSTGTSTGTSGVSSVKEYYCDKSWFLATPVCASSGSKCTTCVTDSTGSYCCATLKTCADLGKNCGTWDNGCGGKMTCGNCSSGQVCSTGVNTGVCCTPKTCANAECGTYSDGCGGTRVCGDCASNETCFVGKCITPCSTGICQPKGHNCGIWTDTCPTGQTVNCGTCSTGQVCDNSMGLCVTKT